MRTISGFLAGFTATNLFFEGEPLYGGAIIVIYVTALIGFSSYE